MFPSVVHLLNLGKITHFSNRYTKISMKKSRTQKSIHLINCHSFRSNFINWDILIHGLLAVSNKSGGTCEIIDTFIR